MERVKNKNSDEMDRITIITQYGPNPASNLREREYIKLLTQLIQTYVVMAIFSKTHLETLTT